MQEFYNAYWEKIKQSSLLLEPVLCFLTISQSSHAKVDPFIEHAIQFLAPKVPEAQSLIDWLYVVAPLKLTTTRIIDIEGTIQKSNHFINCDINAKQAASSL